MMRIMLYDYNCICFIGEMFACDGNCGFKYHVKCAGVIGDAGQYAIPDGEWFCTICTANMMSTEDILANNQEEEEEEEEEGIMCNYSKVLDINALVIEEEAEQEENSPKKLDLSNIKAGMVDKRSYRLRQ